MKYADISKETFGHLYQARKSLKDSPLDQSLQALVELRISQINGCAYCCKVHAQEARKNGISQDKIDVLPGWHGAQEFNETEKVALEWCDLVTHLDQDPVEARELLEPHFSEREIVDLTFCAALMNAFNRIAISLES